MKRARAITLGFLGVLLVLGAWELTTRSGLVDSDLFPTAGRILSRALELLTSAEFLRIAIGASLLRLFTAVLLAFPLATVLGLAVGLCDSLRALIQPVFNFTYSLPKVAVFPLLLAMFGIGATGKVALIGIGIFYPLFLSVMSGTLRLRESPHRDVLTVYGASGVRLYWDFYFRGLSSDLMTGLRVSLGYGFTLVVVSEMSASNDGIGNFIWRAWDSFQIVDMYAGIFALCVVGWVFQTLLQLLKTSRR